MRTQNSSGSAIDWPALPIILDSLWPVVLPRITTTKKTFWDNEALQRIKQSCTLLGFEQWLTVDSCQANLAMMHHLTGTARPAIVIVGNGMCSSDRIVNYLRAMLHDPRHDVLLIGYQAQDARPRHVDIW